MKRFLLACVVLAPALAWGTTVPVLDGLTVDGPTILNGPVGGSGAVTMNVSPSSVTSNGGGPTISLGNLVTPYSPLLHQNGGCQNSAHGLMWADCNNVLATDFFIMQTQDPSLISYIDVTGTPNTGDVDGFRWSLAVPATTLTAPGSGGDSSITVANGGALSNGQPLFLRLTNGTPFVTVVGTISGNTVPISPALPSGVASGVEVGKFTVFTTSYTVIGGDTVQTIATGINVALHTNSSLISALTGISALASDGYGSRLSGGTQNGVSIGTVAYDAPFGMTLSIQPVYVAGNAILTARPTAGTSNGTEGSNPFTTVSGSPIVTVGHTAHGNVAGSMVTWQGAATFNSITLNGTYQVISATANTFTVAATANANASGAGGGTPLYWYNSAALDNNPYYAGQRWVPGRKPQVSDQLTCYYMNGASSATSGVDTQYGQICGLVSTPDSTNPAGKILISVSTPGSGRIAAPIVTIDGNDFVAIGGSQNQANATDILSVQRSVNTELSATISNPSTGASAITSLILGNNASSQDAIFNLFGGNNSGFPGARWLQIYTASGGIELDPAGVRGLTITPGQAATFYGTLSAVLGASTAALNYTCYNSSSNLLTYDSSGTCLVSSLRYKHDVTPIDDPLGRIMSMDAIRYTFNDQTNISGPQLGLSAESVAQKSPELVVYDSNGMPEKVKYQEATGVLVAAAQAQQRQIDSHRWWLIALSMVLAGSIGMQFWRRS